MSSEQTPSDFWVRMEIKGIRGPNISRDRMIHYLRWDVKIAFKPSLPIYLRDMNDCDDPTEIYFLASTFSTAKIQVLYLGDQFGWAQANKDESASIEVDGLVRGWHRDDSNGVEVCVHFEAVAEPEFRAKPKQRTRVQYTQPMDHWWPIPGFENNPLYQGMWKDGKAHGRGELMTRTFSWEGDWENGVPIGMKTAETPKRSAPVSAVTTPSRNASSSAQIPKKHKT
eukprot:TRINITY_DN9049_c0_g1_i2.p1 TRINITY_DN9049_c0_g1~~TRINITY_DN9049_c0_g1_i2.p1  ORF type:complete len:226 (-),score=56.94 TRINITY_DN9049_c0_g1_i2:56-733(-)